MERALTRGLAAFVDTIGNQGLTFIAVAALIYALLCDKKAALLGVPAGMIPLYNAIQDGLNRAEIWTQDKLNQLYAMAKSLLGPLGGLLDSAMSMLQGLLESLGIKMTGVIRAGIIFAALYLILRSYRAVRA